MTLQQIISKPVYRTYRKCSVFDKKVKPFEMAKQSGVVKLKGTIDDITFYKSKDGHMARQKGGVSAEKIANDPAFQRTRENNREFGRAGKAAKLLKTVFRALLLNSADSRVTSRLTAFMMKIIKTDTTNARGDRNVVDGGVGALAGFEFNKEAMLGSTLYAPYGASIDRVTGELEVTVPAFIPQQMVNAPSGTTHIRIVSAGAEIDFVDGSFNVVSEQSAYVPWSEASTALITLTNEVTPNTTKPLFLVLGVEFYQDVNGVKYSLKNGAFNPLAVVKVDA